MAAAEREARSDQGYQRDWVAQLTRWARVAFQRYVRSISAASAHRYEREIRAQTWLDYKLRLMRGEVAVNSDGHDSQSVGEARE